MSNAIDIAKFFIKNGLDTSRNTYDGNMKLQKLLFFADLISLSETGKNLFSEPIRAFSNGCVVENVRLRYKNDFNNLYAESLAFQPNFSQKECDILHLTIEIFGQLSARELSELNHSFSFWKNAYERSRQLYGFKNKDLAIICQDEMLTEMDTIRAVIKAYRENHTKSLHREVINGKTFFYSSDFEITEQTIEQLEDFSRLAEDDTYSVYLENGEMVII